MNLITGETKVFEIIEKFPETLPVFALYGFDAGTKDRLIESVGKNSMLKTILAVKQVNPIFFIKTLNEAVEDMQQYESQNFYERKERGCLNLLAYIPCPMKQFFKENLDSALERYTNETGITFNCDVPMGCGSKDEYEDVWERDNIEDIPDIIISMGFGDFFRKSFVEKFINTGYFKSVLPENINKDFIDSGLIDPDGHYTIYSLHPYVFLIDKLKLGSLPVPETWEDILNPIYKNNVSVGGHGDEISETILIHYLKECGTDALDKLAGNIKNIWHGAEMAKHAGSGSEEGSAIYVMSHFFASTCPKKDVTEIIFPKDGIAASHLYMLVKKSSTKFVKPIIDYIFSTFYGNQSVEQFFPVINGEIKNTIYNGKKIKWIGWDYIKQNDIHAIRDDATKYFISIWKDRALSKV
jgi:ABC-type Fe3+ transport system substrate-binding protein